MTVIPIADPVVSLRRLCLLPILWSKVTAGEYSLPIPVSNGDREYYAENLQAMTFECQQGTALFDPRLCSVTVKGLPSFENNMYQELCKDAEA